MQTVLFWFVYKTQLFKLTQTLHIADRAADLWFYVVKM